MAGTTYRFTSGASFPPRLILWQRLEDRGAGWLLGGVQGHEGGGGERVGEEARRWRVAVAPRRTSGDGARVH